MLAEQLYIPDEWYGEKDVCYIRYKPATSLMKHKYNMLGNGWMSFTQDT